MNNQVKNNYQIEQLLELHPEYYEEIYSQENEESKIIVFEYLNCELVKDKEFLKLIKFHKDEPIIQRRLLEYARIPEIRNNEQFLVAMIDIEDECIEKIMRVLFIYNKIKTSQDFYAYLKLTEKVSKTKILKRIMKF